MKKLLTILFFLPLFVKAQTRFYLTQLTPSVTATFDASWNVTTGGGSWTLLSYRDRHTNTNQVSGASGAVSPRKMLIRQFVSSPLEPQTLNGTVSGQIRYLSSVGGGVVTQAYAILKILNYDGTVSSTVGTFTSSNLTTTLTNRTLPALTLTSVAITAMQRLCIEIGVNYSAGSGTVNTATSSIITSANADLAVNDTDTGANNPWFEFTQSIVRQPLVTGFFF